MTTMELTLKRCTKCIESKPTSEFYASAGMKDGRRPECKSCFIRLVRVNQLGYRNGITLDQYDALLRYQNGRCAGCGTTEPGGQGRWHVDHDHKHQCRSNGSSCGWCTRGLLCCVCNLRNRLVGMPWVNWIVVTGGAA